FHRNRIVDKRPRIRRALSASFGVGFFGAAKRGGWTSMWPEKSFTTVPAPNPDEGIGQSLLENAMVAVARAEAKDETVMVIFGFLRSIVVLLIHKRAGISDHSTEPIGPEPAHG